MKKRKNKDILLVLAKINGILIFKSAGEKSNFKTQEGYWKDKIEIKFTKGIWKSTKVLQEIKNWEDLLSIRRRGLRLFICLVSNLRWPDKRGILLLLGNNCFQDSKKHCNNNPLSETLSETPHTRDFQDKVRTCKLWEELT